MGETFLKTGIALEAFREEGNYFSNFQTFYMLFAKEVNENQNLKFQQTSQDANYRIRFSGK